MNVPIEYTPGSLTVCPSKRDHFKRKGILFRSFFRGYVKFRGCGVNEYPLGFTNISPGNQWVGILISFWGPGLFSGANLLLVLGSVHVCQFFSQVPPWNGAFSGGLATLVASWGNDGNLHHLLFEVVLKYLILNDRRRSKLRGNFRSSNGHHPSFISGESISAESSTTPASPRQLWLICRTAVFSLRGWWNPNNFFRSTAWELLWSFSSVYFLNLMQSNPLFLRICNSIFLTKNGYITGMFKRTYPTYTRVIGYFPPHFLLGFLFVGPSCGSRDSPCNEAAPMDLVSDRLLHQRCARVEGLKGDEFSCLSWSFFFPQELSHFLEGFFQGIVRSWFIKRCFFFFCDDFLFPKPWIAVHKVIFFDESMACRSLDIKGENTSFKWVHFPKYTSWYEECPIFRRVSQR